MKESKTGNETIQAIKTTKKSDSMLIKDGNSKDELTVLIKKFNNDDAYRRYIINKANSLIMTKDRPDSWTPENKLIMDVIMNMY